MGRSVLGQKKVLAFTVGLAAVLFGLVFGLWTQSKDQDAQQPAPSSTAELSDGNTVAEPETTPVILQGISALFDDPETVKEIRVETSASPEAIAAEAGAVTFSTGSTQNATFDEEPSVAHADAYDVTTIVIEFDAGAASCLQLSDMRLSADNAQRTNDGVIIGLGQPNWQFDKTSRQPKAAQDAPAISLQTSSVLSSSQNDQNRTPLLEATLPLSLETQTFYISVFDEGDAAGNVAFSLGQLSFGQDNNCSAGFRLADVSKMVALGDSYTSGFGVAPFEPGTGGGSGANNCQRATQAYPVLLAEMKSLELTSVACQGAFTTDLLGTNSSQNEPPQLEALENDTGLVVLTLGGNDTGWFSKLPDCVVTSVLGPSCAENQAINADLDTTFEQLRRDEKNLNEVVDPDAKLSYQNVVREIRRRSPFATIVIVSYPLFFPAEGAVDSQLERVGIKRCAGVLISDQLWINQRQEELKSLLREAVAAEPGVVVVDSTATFQGHELCSDDPWIMNVYQAGPFHPNAKGHKALADLIVKELVP